MFIYISLRGSVPKCANNLISGEASTTLHCSHKFVNIQRRIQGGGGLRALTPPEFAEKKMQSKMGKRGGKPGHFKIKKVFSSI